MVVEDSIEGARISVNKEFIVRKAAQQRIINKYSNKQQQQQANKIANEQLNKDPGRQRTHCQEGCAQKNIFSHIGIEYASANKAMQ